MQETAGFNIVTGGSEKRYMNHVRNRNRLVNREH